MDFKSPLVLVIGGIFAGAVLVEMMNRRRRRKKWIVKDTVNDASRSAREMAKTIMAPIKRVLPSISWER